MRRWLGRLLPLVAPALLGVAVWVLHRELSGVHYREVAAALQALPGRRVLLAMLLTACGYGVLAGYDGLALYHLGFRLPYRRFALASFLAYAVTNNVGHPLFTSTPIRFRLYSGWGLKGEDIARLVGFCLVGFWTGFACVGGLLFTFSPDEIPLGVKLPFDTTRPFGLLLLAALAGFLVTSVVRKRPLTVHGFDVRWPKPRTTLALIAVSSLDWFLAGSVLFVLLPPTAGLSLTGLLGYYFLAQLAGLLSQIPGGLGVFDTLMVLMLEPFLPKPQVLGAILTYRAVYYLLPLALATLLLAGRELAAHREKVGRWAGRLGRWGSTVVPSFLALSTFIGGVLLLASGATPSVHSRLAWLDRFLPLPVIEVSHFLGSLTGVGLLVLARGLQRRLDAAYVLTAALLALGIVASLLKGLDYEEAILLALMLAALVPCRRHFYRRASLVTERFSQGWVLAVLVALGATTWLGFFSYKHLEYSQDLWWHFALMGNAPRFLRATVGAFALASAVAVARLLRPAPPRPQAPSPADLELANDIVRRQPYSYAHLALLGDKFLLFNDSRTAFVMYGVVGRNWVAMGDPVGSPDEATELVWTFQELALRHGGRPVFYQVRDEALFRYVDVGLDLVKLGEEARVFLPDFSLVGRSRADFRQALRKAEQAGLRFEVVPREKVSELLPELEKVSRAWLAEKGGQEKGFSLGFFDSQYLARCPLAVVYRGSEMVAFANLWEGAEKEELSVDLMRHTAEAPGAVMDYLFTRLLLLGKEQGYRWFNLGMAPLSGLDHPGRSPLWSRLGAALYRHGEAFYHFRGLRQYKNKFEPRWEPRYLAAPGGLALPQALASVTALINGGLRGLLR